MRLRDLRVWWIALLVLPAGLPAARADAEIREFTIRIDNKKAGSYQMTITRQDDGSVTMTGQADVRLSYLVYTYTYSFQGTETWKDHRLVRLSSTSNDDGKRYALTADADEKGVRVRVNGQEHYTRRDVWTTTYWRLPKSRLRNHAVSLLDADTGKEIAARLQFLGNSPVSVAGQMQTCAHYRVEGSVQVELWFDDQERLVRQESIEDGYRTVLELVRLRK